MSNFFIDTNLWIYLYSTDEKSLIVEDIIKKHFNYILISTQILSEIFVILNKKKITTFEKNVQIIDILSSSFSILVQILKES